MLFVEPRFLAFFLCVFALVWGLRSNGARKTVLTIASYAFYAAWDWRFLGLIFFVTLISYVAGLRTGPENTRRWERRIWVFLSVVLSLGVLATFKYFNFFAESFQHFADMAGLPVNSVTLNLVLPVGISFYTFQAISYVADVSRGNIRANRSLLDVMFYISFFPQLVAGPIVRAPDFMPQMETVRRWADVPVRWCLLLFLIGFIKKACLSDNLAPYVDLVFADAGSFQAQAVIAAVFAYGVQIYCDFSGYSDMAIACAGLLGYKFPKNFEAPYLSPDIQQFWRRWHISLSSWLRDYLYIPLGGNRLGEGRRYVNLMTTMLLGGLWHGASFRFIIWGGLHGFALIIEGLWARHVGSRLPRVPVLGALIGTALTFYLVNFAWIFFRAPDFETSIEMARIYLTLQSAGDTALKFPLWEVLSGLAVFHWICHRFKALDRLSSLGPNLFALMLGLLTAVALAFVHPAASPFIYFQF